MVSTYAEKRRFVLEFQNIFSLQLPTKGYPNLSLWHHDSDQYSCTVFLTNLRQATWHSISISLIFLIHFTISGAQEIKAWWNSYTISIFALMHRCLRASMELSQTHPAFFLCHMLRKTRLSTTVKLSRPPPPPPSCLSHSLSLSVSLSLFLFHPICSKSSLSFFLSLSLALCCINPRPSVPCAADPRAPRPLPTLVLFLSQACNTNTHTVHTNTHALLMLHDQSQPPLKKKKKHTNALFRIWKMKQKMSQIMFLPAE